MLLPIVEIGAEAGPVTLLQHIKVTMMTILHHHDQDSHPNDSSNLFKGTSTKVRPVDSLVKSGEEQGDLTIIFSRFAYIEVIVFLFLRRTGRARW